MRTEYSPDTVHVERLAAIVDAVRESVLESMRETVLGFRSMRKWTTLKNVPAHMRVFEAAHFLVEQEPGGPDPPRVIRA